MNRVERYANRSVSVMRARNVDMTPSMTRSDRTSIDVANSTADGDEFIVQILLLPGYDNHRIQGKSCALWHELCPKFRWETRTPASILLACACLESAQMPDVCEGKHVCSWSAHAVGIVRNASRLTNAPSVEPGSKKPGRLTVCTNRAKGGKVCCTRKCVTTTMGW
jgi:hypothetical protein